MSDEVQIFLPRDKRSCRPSLRCYCQWCGARGNRRDLYKLRDGPIDVWFCNDDHALEWLTHRHDPEWNAFLRMTPTQRADSDSVKRRRAAREENF